MFFPLLISAYHFAYSNTENKNAWSILEWVPHTENVLNWFIHSARINGTQSFIKIKSVIAVCRRLPKFVFIQIAIGYDDFQLDIACKLQKYSLNELIEFEMQFRNWCHTSERRKTIDE